MAKTDNCDAVRAEIERISRIVCDASCAASSAAVFIYDAIRDVGYEKTTADNALHRMTEVEHRISSLGSNLLEISRALDTLAL